MAFLDHEGGAEFPFNKDDVFVAIVEAIKKIGGMKVDKADKLSGRIQAKAGVSLTSWGENIPIYVMEISPGITRVSVTSTPKTGVLFGGALDFGKNRKNIEKIFDETSKILNKRDLPIQENQNFIKKTALKCSKCGHQNNEGARFCAKCGENLEDIIVDSSFCPSCGTQNAMNADFCPECGVKLNNESIKTTGNFEDLEKLAELKEKGIITEEEFQAKKKQILGLD